MRKKQSEVFHEMYGEGVLPAKVLLYVKKLEAIIDKQAELIEAPQSVVNLISENAEMKVRIQELEAENDKNKQEIEHLKAGDE